MSTTLGIVEVPCSVDWSGADAVSSRGNSLAARRLGNKSLVEWVVRRVTESLLLDQVAIVADEHQGELMRRLAPRDVSVFVGSQRDGLGRLAAAARHFNARQLVRIPVSCPFIDPELLDRLVCTAASNPGCEYIGYFTMDGRPAVASKVGVFGEWCLSEALLRADREAKAPRDRDPSTHYLVSHPELFQQRFIPIPERLDRRDVRLTIEAEEDWDHVHLIYDALGPERLDTQRIMSLLDHHPALRERMAVLNGVSGTV